MKLNLKNLKFTALTKKFGDLTVTVEYIPELEKIKYYSITEDNRLYLLGFSRSPKNLVDFYKKRFGETNWDKTDEKIDLHKYSKLKMWKEEKYKVGLEYKHPSDCKISEKEFTLNRLAR